MAASPSASSRSQQSLSAFNDTWEVAEILAERQTYGGDTEYLVVWKCCWTSPSLVRDGPVLDNWRTVDKIRTKGSMPVKLPAIYGTTLYEDYVKIVEHKAAEKRPRQQDGNVSTSPPLPSAPRKQLNSVAKRR